jgi:N6-adenosine-specific RNA methylase IME4
VTERFRTIVADPPWHYDKAGGYSWREGRPSGDARDMLAYGTMSVDEITALPIAAMAEDDAHLYLWTTQRYLWDSREIARAWGFKPSKIIVWAKAPTAWGNACEFVLFAKRGRLKTNARIPRDWFEWPRGEHSAKPDAFLDLVEQVSPGPYLELFARRARFGWEYAGNESLSTVKIDGLAA